MIHVAGVALFAMVVLGCGARQTKPAEQQRAKVVVTDPVVEATDPVMFAAASADLSPATTKTLDAIAATIERDETIKLLEVQVHVTDGEAAGRQELAGRRAKAIVDYLISKQVAPERLNARGRVTPPESEALPVVFVIIRR